MTVYCQAGRKRGGKIFPGFAAGGDRPGKSTRTGERADEYRQHGLSPKFALGFAMDVIRLAYKGNTVRPVIAQRLNKTMILQYSY
jgi:hypothetical protein